MYSSSVRRRTKADTDGSNTTKDIAAADNSRIPKREERRTPSRSYAGLSRQKIASGGVSDSAAGRTGSVKSIIPAMAAIKSNPNPNKTDGSNARSSYMQGGGARPPFVLDRGRERPGKNDSGESGAALTKISSVRARKSKPCAALETGTAAASSSEVAWMPIPVAQHPRTCLSRPVMDSAAQWKSGPQDPSGVVLDLSDRPLLCMSVRGSEVAIGGSDHGVYVVDVAEQKLRRNLYGKKDGHVDWVTCVDFLDDGRIISGGMDNALCLWEPTGVRCTVLPAHTASISGVKVIDGKYALSASYDKTLLLWDLSSARTCQQPMGSLQGHRGAVLEFAVNAEAGILSGSREGEVFLWDGRDGRAVLRCRSAHDGHVTAVECLRDAAAAAAAAAPEELSAENAAQELFLTGGQDGLLRVWDMRTKAPVHTVNLSRSIKGKGAVTNIAVTSLSKCGPPLVIAASADAVIRVLEPRSSFKAVLAVHDHTDFIYSLYTCGSLMWSGAGNGNFLVHDLTDGTCLYGLGATNNGAPRCISLVGPNDLVVAGDDGNCMMYRV